MRVYVCEGECVSVSHICYISCSVIIKHLQNSKTYMYMCIERQEMVMYWLSISGKHD